MSITCIVTGASRGIGKGAALSLGEMGANVVINYNKNKALAEDVAKEVISFGGRAEIFGADVSDFSSCQKMIEFTAEKFGGIDALVNNAGISPMQSPFDLTDREEWEKVFSVNVFGTFNCTKAVLPHMISKKKGSIVNVSSVWGITGGSCEAVYSSSKAAVIGFTKAMAKELAPSGIRVNALAPGMIETDMNSHFGENDIEEIKKEIPLGKIGTISDMGKIIAFLCSNKSSYITGEVIKADGGWC
ncbi:MAG: glucose 1-dehydrogenase [Clostridia bacterium]|nr:glucose 1-dehydrogenase [Clostridia bacterium]